MDEIIRNTGVTLLMESYTDDGNNLFNSLRLAGFNPEAVVIDDDGFLPDGMISMYGYFLGDYEVAGESFAKNGRIVADITDDSILGHPRYFNQISIPEYWEITATNSDGKIMDKNIERGHIYYAEPKHRRLVGIVEWTDSKRNVRLSDHYNKYGALYARTTFNAKGQRVCKSYFSVEHKEIIVENYVTKDIMLNTEAGVEIFSSKADFVAYFLRVTGLDKGRIMYNSLSTPFFSTLQLEENNHGDVMFWQENTGDDIPGNMQFILKGNAKRTNKVFVQKKNSFDRLMELGASPEAVKYLGFIYEFKRVNKGRANALICTNSDNIIQLAKLVEELPVLHFNVVALTEMSSKLMDFDKYENVSLYPCAKPSVQEALFAECDYYLDINRESEILSAVQNAFMNNMLVLGFEEVAHNRNYVSAAHLFNENDCDKLIDLIKSTMADEEILKNEIDVQNKAALFESVERYQELLG